jgi:hypothetical protein
MPRKTFADGDALPASDVNTFLMNQAVQTYADGVARTASLPSPTDGQVTTRADSKNLEIYYGQYRPLPFAMAAGSGSIPAPTANNTASVASFTFPANRFTVAPVLTVSAQYTTANSKFVVVRSVSETGFDATLYQQSGGTMQSSSFYYIAIQMANLNAVG